MDNYQNALHEAQNGPQLPTGPLDTLFADAGILLRKEVEKEKKAIETAKAVCEKAADTAKEKCSDPRYVPEIKVKRAIGNVEIGETDYGTVAHVSGIADVAISNGQLVMGNDVKNYAMSAAIARGAVIAGNQESGNVKKKIEDAKNEKRGYMWYLDRPAPVKAEAVKHNVLVIDNKGAKSVTVHMQGEGKDVKLDTPLHIMARGPLKVNLAHGSADKYSNQPLIVSTVGEKGKPPPIEVQLDKSVELRFFNPGDGFSPNKRYLKGLVADKEGNVTGFQAEENGPIVQLQPDQKLTLHFNGWSQRTQKVVVPGESITIYERHTLEVHGGGKEKDVIKDLRRQYDEQNKKFPTQEMDVPLVPPPPHDVALRAKTIGSNGKAV